MGLIRLGASWEKSFKNGNGFSGQLMRRNWKRFSTITPRSRKITILVFDNAKGLEKNDRAPHFVIYAPDGEDDNRGDGGDRGRRRNRANPTIRRRENLGIRTVALRMSRPIRSMIPRQKRESRRSAPAPERKSTPAPG